MTTERDESKWVVAWTFFAAVWMWILGSFHAMAGLVGVLNDEFYLSTPKYIFQLDSASWGWIHLILGVVVVLAGFALFTGAIWARTVGVVVAVLSMLVNFAWLPWYPIWGVLMIAANVFVIWALTVHGREWTE
jgi:hypothetical protein